MLVVGKKSGKMKIRDSLDVGIPGGGRLDLGDVWVSEDHWDVDVIFECPSRVFLGCPTSVSNGQTVKIASGVRA